MFGPRYQVTKAFPFANCVCSLFGGKMNTSVICQFESLCTFHLFAERGVQSGRDRGYVRARRQPSSFLGDEDETFTKIIEEMASFQLYSFVSPSPTPHICCRLSFFFLRQPAYAIAHTGGKVPESASSQSTQTLSFIYTSQILSFCLY